jgi:DNA/RNA-binding domain of Phe-tRNA-synthetase-like protein
VILFRYSAPILERFPGVVGGVVLVEGACGTASPSLLRETYLEEQRVVLARLGDATLASIPSLAAWRRAFSAFGVEPTRYRSAAEALLRRLTKQGSIPSLGTLVDIGNLVSIRYALPVAVFDLRDATGGTTVRFADGSERFTDLGSDTEQHPDPGEVVFVDDAGLVSARRWCWRQSAQSAACESTASVLISVEGHHEGALGDVTSAVADLEALLAEHQPAATVRSAILSTVAPAFDVPTM